MAADALVKDLLRTLRTHGSARRREAATWYYPTAMQVFGTPVPVMRKVTRGVHRQLDAEDTMFAVDALLASNTFEGRQAAYELLYMRQDVTRALPVREVERIGHGIDNWASVDAYCCLVAGIAWRDGRVSDASIRRWSRSQDRWWRRAALVATVPLNLRSKGGSGDVARTLAVCERHAADTDGMVAKALSWALRELIPYDARRVRAFLKKHDAHLASRVRREVLAKLETGRKQG